MGCFCTFDDMILSRVPQKCRGQLSPSFNGKTEAKEKERLTAADRMRGIKQVTRDLLFRYNRKFYIRQFHGTAGPRIVPYSQREFLQPV